jgi:hypothetical protein
LGREIARDKEIVDYRAIFPNELPDVELARHMLYQQLTAELPNEAKPWVRFFKLG